MLWMDTAKSGFLTALEHFWNGWACLRKDVLLIICGFTKDTQEQLHRRGRIFREATGVKKAIGYALVTTVSLKRNAYSGAVQSVVTLDDLFKE